MRGMIWLTKINGSRLIVNLNQVRWIYDMGINGTLLVFDPTYSEGSLQVQESIETVLS